MNHNLYRFVLAAAMTLTLGAVALDANAAYSGLIRRSVCPSGSFVNVDTLDTKDIRGSCQIDISDPGGPAALEHFFRLSIPVERTTTSTNVSTRVSAFGGAGPAQKVCVQVRSFNAGGGLVTNGPNTCTVGALPSSQYVNPPSVSLPVDGSLEMTVRAMKDTSIFSASHVWQANGT